MAKAIREVYGESLVKYGAEYKNVVVLDTDVSSSTKSGLFGAAYPDRFYNCGISEYAMVGMGAGMALNGKIPFVNTFAVFMTTLGAIGARTLMSYSNINLKMMGAYGGLSDSYDGATHQALEDIAVMRSLPGMTVMVASDAGITEWMTKTAIETQGPMYIRLSRGVMEDCHPQDTQYQIGKGVVVKDGCDVTIFACGVMVSKAVEAANLLEKQGLSARVVDMFTIKPIDKDLILSCARETKAAVTCEEHSIIGGLGSAVAEVLSTNDVCVPLEMVGTKDCHGESGAYDDLLKKFGLDSESIVSSVQKVILRKDGK